MKEWHCESCGRWRTTGEEIVIKICQACQVEMKLFKPKYEVIYDA